jgi:hypothetical protein
MLSGKRGGSAVDVAAFLGACRVKSPERDQVLALCSELHPRAGCSNTAPGCPKSW